MKKYKVYMHIFPNNKVYVGITTQKVNRRWNNGKGYKNNEYMTNAIIKYGWDNITHKILYDNLSKEEAEQKEKELIKYYNADGRNCGYNILSGGNVSNGFTQETINKMSVNTKRLWENPYYRERVTKSHLGKKLTNETKEKMSRNNAKVWLGKHLTEETKKKISEKKKGSIAWNKGTRGMMKANKTSFKNGEIHSKTRKVKCVEKGIIYDTINNASRQLQINATCIINVCKGKQNVAGGYHWEYVT